MLAADALELFHNFVDGDTGSKRQGHQPSDGFRFCGGGSAGFADGRKNLKRVPIELRDRDIKVPIPGFDPGRKPL